MTQLFTVPYLPPFEWESLLAWLRVRALPGVEDATDTAYATAVALPSGPAVLRMTNDAAARAIRVTVSRTDGGAGAGEADDGEGCAHLDDGDITVARSLVVRMLDLDADPSVIDTRLAGVPVVGTLVAQAPGMRIPGEPTPLLALIRALAGQQVSVAGGLAQMYRLVEACRDGARSRATDRGPSPAPGADGNGASTVGSTRGLAPFPDADAILAAGFDWYRGPSARRESIRQAVEFAAVGGLAVSRGTETIAADLLALKGIGPWTVAYTMMRGYGDPDVDLSGDRALVNAARALSDVPLGDILDAARPFRSYAALYLWRSAGS